MKIKWYGQASFLIQDSEGCRIVTDPYDPNKSGYKPFPDPADIIIKSSSSDDFHDNDHLVPKREGAVVVDALDVTRNGGLTTVNGRQIKAVQAMEHLDHPSGHPDQNAMYRFAVDGIEIGHMGDMGNDFSDEQLEFFQDIDILLSHAGGFPVISLQELIRVIDIVAPKLVIPMHFRTLRFKPRNMYFLSEFLKLYSEERVDFVFDCEAVIHKFDLPWDTRVRVLDYY